MNARRSRDSQQNAKSVMVEADHNNLTPSRRVAYMKFGVSLQAIAHGFCLPGHVGGNKLSLPANGHAQIATVLVCVAKSHAQITVFEQL